MLLPAIFVVLLAFGAKGIEIIENSGEVCYGARDRSFGSLRVRTSGTLVSVKLQHVSGLLACHKGLVKSLDGRWGCELNKRDGLNMMTVITRSDDQVVLPRPMLVRHDKLWKYELPGYNINSREIEMTGLPEGIPVEKNEELRIWYSEDLMDYTTDDNAGRHCVKVVARIQKNEIPKVEEALESKRVVVNHGKVCYGTSAKSFGSFQVKVPGILVSLKLQHLSGHLSCHKGLFTNYISKWGCDMPRDDGMKMMTVITKADDKVILPPKDMIKLGNKLQYKLPGYNINSEEIKLRDLSERIRVLKGEELRIWYSEDLIQHTTDDNDGIHCVNVIANILKDDVKEVVRPLQPEVVIENHEKVCYGAKDDLFGLLKVRTTGTLVSLKLQHLSGLLSCKDSFLSSYASKWGCDMETEDGLKMMTVVTRADNRIVLPKPEETVHDKIWRYKLQGYNINSEEIELRDMSRRIRVRHGEELRIWYSEALMKQSIEDNEGTHCVKVIATIMKDAIPVVIRPVEKDMKVIENYGKVCYGAKEKLFGSFIVSTTGTLLSLKLQHVIGRLNCHKGFLTSFESKWGCDMEREDGLKMMTVVTRADNRIVLPKPEETVHDKIMRYKLQGYNINSEEIELRDMSRRIRVRHGEELRIWYSEALMKQSTEDNEGIHCVKVIATILKEEFPVPVPSDLLVTSNPLKIQIFCNGKENGVYPDPENCGRFIKCFSQKIMCPENQRFDDIRRKCVRSQAVLCRRRPKIVNLGQVCYGTDENSFGVIKMKSTGVLMSLRLRHLTGLLKCGTAESLYGYWGCDVNQRDPMKMMTVITTSDDRIVFPATIKSVKNKNLFYRVPGYNIESNEIVLKDISLEGLRVTEGETLKVWYTRALLKQVVYLNPAKHCVQVYGTILEEPTKVLPVLPIQPIDFCAGKMNGIHVDPLTCDGYIHCARQQVECQMGFLYNEELRRCIPRPLRPKCLGRPLFEHHGTICYGAMENTPGSFRMKTAGHLVALRLVHVSGYLNCDNSKTEYRCKWGCKKPLMTKRFATIITDSKDAMIFPTPGAADATTQYYYTLPEYDVDSPEIIFRDPTYRIKVAEGDLIKIHYGEDFAKYTTIDNEGRHCVGVYTKVIPRAI